MAKGQKKLFDGNPENVKPLIKKARQWRGDISKRLAIQIEEATEKDELRELVKESGLRPLEDGNILFTHEGVTIKVEPDIPGKITVTIDEDWIPE